MPRFTDRREGGRQLAQRLIRFAGDPGVIILGLPRGGGRAARVLERGGALSGIPPAGDDEVRRILAGHGVGSA